MSGRERYSTPRELRSEADNLRAQALMVDGIGNMVRLIAQQARVMKVLDGCNFEDTESTADMIDAAAALRNVVEDHIDPIVHRLCCRADDLEMSAALQEPAVS